MSNYEENEVPSEVVSEKVTILIALGATNIVITLTSVGFYKITYTIDS